MTFRNGYYLRGPYMLFNGSPGIKTVEFTNIDMATWAHMFTSCGNLETFKVSGIQINGVFCETFLDCPKLKSVIFDSTCTGGTDRMDGMFESCPSLTYIDMRSLTININNSLRSVFNAGSSHFASADGKGGSVSGDPGTLLLGKTNIVNSMFWFQSDAGFYNVTNSKPSFVLGSNVKVEIGTGPTSVSSLVPCLDITVDGVNYAYAGVQSSFTNLTVPSSYKDSVWKKRGYFGGTGTSTSGDVGYGTSSGGTTTSTVKYLISGDTLYIYSYTSNGRLRNISTSSPAPWAGNKTIKKVQFSYSSYTTPVYGYQHLAYMFSGLSSLEYVDMSNLRITSSVTDMSFMFPGTNLKGTVGTSGTAVKWPSTIDTSGLGNASNMFQGCTGLTGVDISNFGTKTAAASRACSTAVLASPP